jgi:hypothetical protein
VNRPFLSVLVVVCSVHIGTGIAFACDYVDPQDDPDGYFQWCRCTGGRPNFSGGIYRCIPVSPPPPRCRALPRIPEHVQCAAGRDSNNCPTLENCQLECFYAFANPERVPDDLTVRWLPGSRCVRWPHVYAGKRVPEADEGWTWANPLRRGDFSVKPIAQLPLACTSSAKPSCAVYSTCFERVCNCEATEDRYFISYGKKYCDRFLDATQLSAAGQRWRDRTLVCLQEKIVPHLPLSSGQSNH